MTSTSKRYCSVPQCNNYVNDRVSMHYFPRDEKLRKIWKHVLKIDKPISKYMNVCSEHFIEKDYFVGNKRKLKKGVIPSKKLPKGTHDNLQTTKVSARAKRMEKRNTLNNASERNETCTRLNLQVLDNSNSTEDELDMNINHKIPNLTMENKECQINLLMKEISPTIIDYLFQCDRNLLVYTGISVETFVKMEECILQALPVWEITCNNPRERLLLTLIKMKLDISFRAVAVLFNVSSTTAQNYFHDMVYIMSETFKKIIYFPSQYENKCNMPKCFLKFQNVRVVLDCTELRVQKPKCLPCRIRTYSNYKRTHTIKYMIGMTPAGTISFVSSGFGGRTSDKQIVNKENIMQMLEPFHDAVMVDKGVLIEQECLHNGIILIQPPFLRDRKQLTREEAIRTADIARARVHVERAIQRMKVFKIISNTIEFSMLPYIDNIVKLICIIVNLSPAILSDARFL